MQVAPEYNYRLCSTHAIQARSTNLNNYGRESKTIFYIEHSFKNSHFPLNEAFDRRNKKKQINNLPPIDFITDIDT